MREARAALAASQWRQAIDLLRVHVHAYADDADAHNLLGYSLRQLGHYIDAQAAYERALQLDPSHQGAHAYMGELMLTQGRRDRALFHLTQLEQICQGNCAEYMQLKNAIDRDDSKISPRRW
jgi:Flp pilus assembly protein TadD